MKRKKIIGGLTLCASVIMLSVGIIIQNESAYKSLNRVNAKEFKIENMSASVSQATKTNKQQEVETPTVTDINMEVAKAGVLREEVYEGMTLDEVAAQLNKSLKNEIAGKGMFIASKSLELGVDPFVATAIIMHETGCGQNSCSHIARTCYNFGGQKGSGCGAYQRYGSIDEGLEGMISNLYRNYYARGLTTVESIGPRYAESGEWISKINWYVGRLKSA